MNQQHSDDFDLIEYIRIIYKYRFKIIIVMLISVVFAGVLSLAKPKIYEATASFFPLDVSYSIQADNILVNPRLEIEDLISSILKSRKMAQRIDDKLDLKKVLSSDSAYEIYKFLSCVTSLNIDNNGVIHLSVRTEDPNLSANIANSYVDNLDYFNCQMDLGAQRSIVQVIDRAVVPEKRMGRGTKRNILIAAFLSFTLMVLLSFFIEFLKKSNFIERIKAD
ncbi:MAG: Wzz/FepE/Etk N-terminal domain-containing protein [Candidatus Omnitrophota bacterium]